MESTRTNKKGLFFLIALSVFSFFAIKNIDTPEAEEKEIKNPEIVTTVEASTDVIKTSGDVYYALTNEGFEEVQPEVVKFVDGNVIDITEDVLGEEDGMDGLCAPVDIDRIIDVTSKACKEQSPEIDFNEPHGGDPSGDLVSLENAEITLTKVTYPMLLWKGKYVMKSSNKEISLEDPAFNANGEQITMERMRAYYEPEVAMGKESELEELDYYRDPFEVAGNIEVGDTGDEGDVSAVVSSTMLPVSDCGKEVTENDFNPETSNKVSQNLYPVLQAPDSDMDGIGDEYESISTPSCLPSTEIVEISSGKNLFTACEKNAGNFISDFFSKLFGGGEWDKCEIHQNEEGEDINPQSCVDVENIVIKMSPIFGNLETCEDGVCTNVYMTNKVRGQMSPDQAEAQTFQIATPCEINIDPKDGASQDVPVQCLWDATPVLLNYYQQQMNTHPNQEDFPESFDIYWKSVLKAIEEDK